eukprot:scaffold51602_cov41-Prasinocladus_malaysianus.AAC.1
MADLRLDLMSPEGQPSRPAGIMSSVPTLPDVRRRIEGLAAAAAAAAASAASFSTLAEQMHAEKDCEEAVGVDGRAINVSVDELLSLDVF